MKNSGYAIILVFCGFTLAATTIPAWAEQDCSEKVTSTCTTCHYPARICEKLGKKSRREWKTTVKRMLRYGLTLTDTDLENILQCLSTLDKSSGNLCK